MPPELPVPEGDRCYQFTAHQEELKEAGQSVLPMWLIPSPGSSPCPRTTPSTRNLKISRIKNQLTAPGSQTTPASCKPCPPSNNCSGICT
ncbi:hypothetical protein ATANTOWER_007513 [Ataeniobius toweri]|uniref:Uncharacterized protein n=1 Tax=Ataeniobius toweri TaxID=208326 RepID=A0ABU7AX72_9TELE|nr:hypothetical protein [Ataeniobius toweri]